MFLVEGDQCSKKKLGKISCTFFAQKQTKSLSGEEMCAYERFLLFYHVYEQISLILD